MAGRQRLHARRHQFLFPLRDDGGAHVSGDGDRRSAVRGSSNGATRITARPAVAEALAGEDRTAPGSADLVRARSLKRRGPLIPFGGG